MKRRNRIGKGIGAKKTKHCKITILQKKELTNPVGWGIIYLVLRDRGMV